MPRSKKHSYAKTAAPPYNPVGSSRAPRSQGWSLGLDFGTISTSVTIWHDGLDKYGFFTIDESFPGVERLDLRNNQVPSEMWYPTKLNKGHKPLFGHEKPQTPADKLKYQLPGHVALIKILNDTSSHTETARKKLISQLNKPQGCEIIKNHAQVIEDFFCRLLRSIKSHLTTSQGLKEHHTIQIVFAVPVCATGLATNYIATKLEAAMIAERFGTDGITPCDLFAVSEAEAQATNALSLFRFKLRYKEGFLIVDCGGGTLDLGVYHVESTWPLRLKPGVCITEGYWIGAIQLNQRFHNFVEQLIKNNLKPGHMSVEDIMSKLVMPVFETTTKRTFSLDKEKIFYIDVPGLEGSLSDTRVQPNLLVLDFNDLWDNVFKETVIGIGDKVTGMLQRAKGEGHIIETILISGGFGGSPCLQQHLSEIVDKLNNSSNRIEDGNGRITRSMAHLSICFMRNSADSVSSGAILRAQDPTNGPERILQQSIGVKEDVPVQMLAPEGGRLGSGEWAYQGTDTINKRNQKNIDEVVLKQSERVQNPITRQWYIPDTARWLARKVSAPSQSPECLDGDLMPKSLERHDVWPKSAAAGKVHEVGKTSFDVTYMKDQIRAYNRKNRTGDHINEVRLIVELAVVGLNFELAAPWKWDPEGRPIKGMWHYFTAITAFHPGTS
ncbi:hypothetical protein OPT61_g6672 [Boeremia exigua]|uniref:Uncharacterized protein n=1 Tax=Boeremia exigua TaxID=749465 RepID=A0ACC2I5B4_9PLEO|nr:hypothetical protein OPT61_g6672 [Boeremia exigua]